MVGIVTALIVAPLAGRALPPPPQFSSWVRYETFGYPDAGGPGSHWENFFEARVRGVGQLAADLTYEFEVRAVADDAAYTAGAYDLRNWRVRRPYLSILSGTLSYQPSEALRLTIGRIVTSWSNFDDIQPANWMRTTDASDVFRRVDSGVRGFSVRAGDDRLHAEVVVVPFEFTPARLPQGRWQIIRDVDDRSRDTPPVRFEETQVGARLATTIGHLDAALVAYLGRDGMPYFAPNLVFVGGETLFEVELIERYARLRSFGFTGAYAVGENVMVRLESVYFASPSAERDDFIHTIAGVEYALRDWRLQLNYLRDDTVDHAPEDVTNDGQRRFFYSFVFGELRYEPGLRWRALLRGGYDFEQDFLIIQPEVSCRAWQSLYVALVADIVTAQQPSYFYSIRRSDRVGLRVDYHY